MTSHLTMATYGFDPPTFVNKENYSVFERYYSEILARRQSRWSNIDTSITPSRKLKRYIRKGIPEDERGQVWMIISGAKDRMEANPNVYRSASSQKPSVKLMSVIEADIPRTFPENVYFHSEELEGNKLQSLHRVLSAFAWRFPEVGYCQGFNYITGLFLLILRGTPGEVEERAFWLLDALVNHILQPYYTNDMTSVRQDCMVLGELLKEKNRALYDLVTNSEINFTVLSAKWFICVYVDVLPVETTLRILDCLFYEGDKILFRAGLTLIELHRIQLLSCDEFPKLLATFRSMCRDKSTLWCHEFLQSMFRIPGVLSREKIRKLREHCAREIQNDVHA